MSKRKKSPPNSERERIRQELADAIKADVLRFKRSIIREIDRLWRSTSGEATPERLDELIDLVAKRYRMKAADKKAFAADVRESSREIKGVWDEYFSALPTLSQPSPGSGEGAIKLAPGEYEKLRALTKIDFSQVEADSALIVTEQIRRAAREGIGYEALNAKLKRQGLGSFEAATLANTALAQFDNGLMHEYAAQAGITRFEYYGVSDETTRQFCKERVGKIFTIDEIMKMDNGQGIPVLTSLGGFRCRHAWSPVVERIND